MIFSRFVDEIKQRTDAREVPHVFAVDFGPNDVGDDHEDCKEGQQSEEDEYL